MIFFLCFLLCFVLLIFVIVKVKPLNVTTMRKITFFIMAAVAVLTATAQDNVPDAFDSDTAYWVTSMESEYESSYTAPIVTAYRSCGDSVVDGLHGKRCIHAYCLLLISRQRVYISTNWILEMNASA